MVPGTVVLCIRAPQPAAQKGGSTCTDEEVSDLETAPDRMPYRPDVRMWRTGQGRCRYLREMHLTRTLVTPQGATGVRRRLTTPSGHAVRACRRKREGGD